MKTIVNKKMLGLAYAIEGIVISSTAFAGFQFAQKYATDKPVPSMPGSMQVAALGWATPILPSVHNLDWWMAIVGAGTLCVAEMARVPLVSAAASHSNWKARLLALTGAVMMVGVTTKSLSQVFEQTFHPRLRQVQMASNDLRIAQKEVEILQSSKESPVSQAAIANEQLARLDAEISDMNKTLQGFGKRPEAKTVKVGTRKNSEGKWVNIYKTIQPDWPGTALMDQIDDAREKRDELLSRHRALSEKSARVSAQVTNAEAAVTARKADVQDAVMNSQLHSFTAMIYGKDPVQVTDDEVHAFLRFFIFLPSLMIASASSLLAYTAFTRIKLPRPVPARPAQRVILEGTLRNHFLRIAKGAK
jgi:hypothetical protein